LGCSALLDEDENGLEKSVCTESTVDQLQAYATDIVKMGHVVNSIVGSDPHGPRVADGIRFASSRPQGVRVRRLAEWRQRHCRSTVTSAFGWLDTDSEQRRKMLEVVELFKDEGTVDELGIGSIRDALAGALFPGTSVLHTRIRYVLFVPWLLRQAASKNTPAEMSTELRSLEVRLIDSLLAGGETFGVIGRVARRTLKRMPSSAYWPALGSWNISSSDRYIDGFFRRQADYRQLMKRTVVADDPESARFLPGTGLDPHIPPPPPDLLKVTDFALTAEEERYLSGVIADSTAGSMLSWLISHPPGNQPDYAWDLDNLVEAPGELVQLVDHARRFHSAIYGAPLLYNLLLAEKGGRDELVVEYEDELARWRDELDAARVLDGWSRAEWWVTIRRHHPRVAPRTMTFIDDWLDLLQSEGDVSTSKGARDLISRRERQIKGGRSRFLNQAALDRWSGGSGTGRLDYRWTVTWRHLQDLYDARESL
jgi:hypothetical protein